MYNCCLTGTFFVSCLRYQPNGVETNETGARKDWKPNYTPPEPNDHIPYLKCYHPQPGFQEEEENACWWLRS